MSVFFFILSKKKKIKATSNRQSFNNSMALSLFKHFHGDLTLFNPSHSGLYLPLGQPGNPPPTTTTTIARFISTQTASNWKTKPLELLKK